MKLIEKLWGALYSNYIIKFENIEFDIECSVCEYRDCGHIEMREYNTKGWVCYNRFQLGTRDAQDNLKNYLSWELEAELRKYLSGYAQRRYRPRDHLKAIVRLRENYHSYVAYCADTGCANFVAHGQKYCGFEKCEKC